MPPDREGAREEPFLGDWAMREVTLSAGPGPSRLEVVVARADHGCREYLHYAVAGAA